MITERQTKILNGIVEEYIKSAEPVSSQALGKKRRFEISPAMLRIEMQKLAEMGYLAQPHTSAGRIPTDKGYRFFVDGLFEKNLNSLEDMFGLEGLFREQIGDAIKFNARLTKLIAHASSNFTFLHLLNDHFSWKEGWEEIIKEPEFEQRDFAPEFADFLEDFEKEIESFELSPGMKIYIGGENPFSKTKDFSIISSRCLLPNDGEALLAILGPKRMDYEKNINLVNYLIGALVR